MGRVKRKIEYGCLLILTIAWALFMLWWLFKASILPAKGASLNELDTLDCGTFSVVYDPALRIPITADWEVSRQYIGDSQREPSWRFAEDTRVSRPRATHQDYTRSGYDRGHLCPAADRSRSKTNMRTTFIMTNVCPQAPTLNRGEWKKLETACRNIARHGQALSIHVDAVFWPADTQRIGKNRVAVPHGFVKTIRDFLTDTICYSKYFQNW